MSCSPSYAYTPSFTPSNVPCVAPVYPLHRSRAAIPGDGLISTPLFFRSKEQNSTANSIAVELTIDGDFNVYFESILVETYTVTFGAGAIGQLRDLINNVAPNPYVEMPEVGFDVYDTRTQEDDGDGLLLPGLAPFPLTSFTGGQGAPTDASTLATIRTGPSRSVFIVSSVENVTGADDFPPPSLRIQQWNGTQWISYCNNVQGECPGEGTC